MPLREILHWLQALLCERPPYRTPSKIAPCCESRLCSLHSLCPLVSVWQQCTDCGLKREIHLGTQKVEESKWAIFLQFFGETAFDHWAHLLLVFSYWSPSDNGARGSWVQNMKLAWKRVLLGTANQTSFTFFIFNEATVNSSWFCFLQTVWHMRTRRIKIQTFESKIPKSIFFSLLSLKLTWHTKGNVSESNGIYFTWPSGKETVANIWNRETLWLKRLHLSYSKQAYKHLYQSASW